MMRLGALLVLFAVLQDRPASPPSSAQPFVSRVIETEFGTGMWERPLTPERTTVEKIYYGVPVAINVPFEVPFKGARVRIYQQVRFKWETEAAKKGFHLSMPSLHTHGLYRMDGAALKEKTAYFEDSSSPEVKKWQELWHKSDAGVPCYVNARAEPKFELSPLQFRTDSDDPPFHHEYGVKPFLLDRSEPGWYVFFFTVPMWSTASWPDDTGDLDELKAKFRVSIVVSTAEQPLFMEDAVYLFKGGEKPKTMRDEKSYRAFTYEIPVTLRRDAWVFDRAEAGPIDGKEIRKRHDRGEDEVCTVEAAAQVQGHRVKATHKTSSTLDSKPFLDTAATYEVAFPTVVKDGDIGDVSISGTFHEKYHQPRPGWWTPLTNTGWLTQLGSTSGEFNHEMELIQTNLESASDDSTLRRRASKKQAELWNLEPTLKRGQAPVKEPVLYRYYGTTPRRFALKKVPASNVISICAGPYLVKGYYRRLKDDVDSGGGVRTPPATVSDDLDPFWEWFVTFHRLLKAKKAVIDEGRMKASILGTTLNALRRDNKQLQEFALLETTSDRLKASLLRHVGRLGREIKDCREQIDHAFGEAQQAIEDILAELDRAYGKYGARHGELLLWKKAYADQRDFLAVEFALVEGDPDSLAAALQVLEQRGVSARVRLLEAELRRKMNDAVGALYALRSAVRIEPDNPEAQRALRDLECDFLRAAIQKAHGTIQTAREKFFTYLKERGFEQDALKRRWVYVPVIDLDRETAWAIFTTGPSGILAGLMDKPGAMEALLAERTEELTRAHLGLHSMLFLRSRGKTFDRIKTMTTKEIFDVMPLKNTQGRPYTDAQAHFMGTMIREAMHLEDIRALVNDDRPTLEAAVKKSYWNPYDMPDSWIEFIGDAASVKNLILLLLPSAIARVGGKFVAGGYLSAETAAALAEAKSLETGVDVLARLVRWNRALEWLKAKPAGQYLMKTLERSHQFQQSLGTGHKIAWTLEKAVAVMVLQGISMHVAAEVGGPECALIMEMLWLLAFDAELLGKLMGVGQAKQLEGVIERRLLPAIDKKMDDIKLLGEDHGKLQKVLESRSSGAGVKVSEDVQKAEKELLESLYLKRRVREILDKHRIPKTLKPEEIAVLMKALGPKQKHQEYIRKIIAKRADGTALTDAEIEVLEKEFGTNWRNAVPEGEAAQDVLIAYDRAIEAWIDGRRDGSEKAARILMQEAEEEAQKLAEAGRKIEELRSSIKSIRSKNPLPEMIDDYASLPGYVKPTKKIQQAEMALQADRYDDAARAYQEAIDEIFPDTVVTREDLDRLKVLQSKLEMCEKLKTTPRPTLDQASLRFADAIDDAQRDAIAASKDRWIHKRDLMTANSNTFETPDGRYYIKELGGKKSVEAAQAEFESELVNYELARELGIATPGMTTATIDGKRYLIYRKIEDGLELNKLPPEMIFHYRHEIARHRALAGLTGDFDRHLENYMVTPDGRLYAIDQGYGDIRGMLARETGIDPSNEAYFEGILGRDHWWIRYHRDLTQFPPDPDAVKGILYEGSLTYNAAKPTIDKVLSIVGDDGRLMEILQRAYQRGYPDRAEAFAKQAAQHLKMRAGKLDGTLRGLNQRNGVPLPQD